MKIIRKYKNYFIMLLAVIIIFCSYLFINNIHPFGTNNIYFGDMESQYFYYIYNFKYRFLNGLSLKYSFNTGLGFPFYKLFFTYLSCPLMFLSVLFKDIQLFLFLFILFFLVLSSFSMYSYFKYKYKKDSIYYVLIAISYAFSGWVISYYEHIQWLPVIALLPLIIKYLEILIKDNKTLGYFITLALSILCNYYLSMFVCVFIVLYYFLYCLLNKKFSIKNILLFSITSLLAGGIISVLLVPFLKDAALSTSASTHVFYTDISFYNPSFFEFLYRLFSYSLIDSIGYNIHGPNISLSIITLIFFFSTLFSKSNNKRKVLYISLLLIYFLPFISIEINYMFNFMRVSNGGFFRHSFIFVFVMCLMAGEYDFSKLNNKKNILISILLLNIVFLVYLFYEKADINFLIINCTFIIFNSIIMMFNKKTIFNYLLVCMIIVELILSFSLNVSSSDINFLTFNTDNNYRTEIKITSGRFNNLFNNSYFNNNYSLTSYSSLLYSSVFDFSRKVGLYSNYNHIFYNNDFAFYHLLFNIKHVYSGNKLISNDDALGYMFIINKNNKDSLIDNPIENQNNIFKDFTGIDNLYKKIEYNSKDIKKLNDIYTVVSYKFDTKDDIYYFFDDESVMMVSDGVVDRRLVHPLGTRLIDLNVSNTGEINAYYDNYDESKEDGFFYTFNKDKFNEGIDYLKTRTVNITTFKEDYIKAQIDTKESSSIYTSIPYDEGWKVYINGKVVDTYVYKDTFLMFDIPEGNNTIELKYSINHLETGIILSIVSLIGYCLLYYLEKRKHS